MLGEGEGGGKLSHVREEAALVEEWGEAWRGGGDGAASLEKAKKLITNRERLKKATLCSPTLWSGAVIECESKQPGLKPQRCHCWLCGLGKLTQCHYLHLLCALLCSIMSHSFATPQCSVSMGFSSQEHWNGLLFPTPGDLPDPGIELVSLKSPALAVGSFTPAPPGKPTTTLEMFGNPGNKPGTSHAPVIISICLSLNRDNDSTILQGFLEASMR